MELSFQNRLPIRTSECIDKLDLMIAIIYVWPPQLQADMRRYLVSSRAVIGELHDTAAQRKVFET